MKIGVAETVFWLSLGAVAYTYVLYPLLLILLASLKQIARDVFFLGTRQNRRSSSPDNALPSVALLCAAYNEETVIEDKLHNAARLEYTSGKIEFLLGLDAPTDSTAERARRVTHPRFRILPFPVRRGKLAVLNELAQSTSAEVLIFSDANTMLEPDCVRKLVRHFAEPNVGAVCGEVRVVSSGKAKMEPLYWRYEMVLKFLENRLNCVLGANGAVYAVRRSLFHLSRDWIIEDFQVPMEIRFAGHRVVYDPEAVAFEEAAPTLSAEFSRKVRIGAGDYQTLFGNLRFLNPLRGFPPFAYFSHKVLRWLVPYFLLSALFSNLWLVSRPFFAVTLAAQFGFYLLAGLGYWQQRRGEPSKLCSVPLYVSLMNVALLVGMLRFFRASQDAAWNVMPRQTRSVMLSAKVKDLD